MNKKIFLYFVLSIISSSITGQTSIESIKGVVIDEFSVPIIGVAIVMFDSDSTYLNSTVSDLDGTFNLKIETTPYRLLFQHLTYEQWSITSDAENIGNVILKENAALLGEVVVKGERPIVKIEDGKLSYDLQAVAQNKAVNNAYDALIKLPGIREREGGLELTGAGIVNVIINGKPSTMTSEQLENLLRATPVERVEKAEIMYSTPPQYHVRGASINLVLHRSYDYSFSGEVHGDYTNRHFNSLDVGGNLVFSTPDWSADVTYSGGENKNIARVNLLSRHTLNGTINTISQTQNLISKGNRHSIRAAIEYAPKDNGSLSAVYTGQFKPNINSTTDADGTFVKSNNIKNGNDGMHNGSLFYKSTFGFDAGIDYTQYNSSSFSKMENLYKEGEITRFNTDSKQSIDKVTAYVNQQHSLKNNWGITYGASFNWTQDNDLQKYNVEEGNISTTNTNSMLQEYVTNVYGGFSKQLKKGNLSLSLAGEYYQVEDYRRWTLYPQASFLWEFDEKNFAQFSFSSDKTYPSYWDMQQAITYLDGYSEIHGNTWLRPMRTYSTQFLYMLKKKYMFVLFWNEMPDYFTQTAYQSPERLALVYQTLNWDYNRQYGGNLIIPFKFGTWLDSRLTLTGLNMKQKCSSFYDISFDRSKMLGVAQLDNSMKISQKPNLTLDISGYYQTEAIQGTYDIDPSWSLDAGVKWTFAKDKATLSARCSDIFNTSTPFTKIRVYNQNIDMESGAFTRMFTVYFSYRFSGYKEKTRNKVDTSRFGH